MIDEYTIELASRFSINLHKIVIENIDDETKDKLIISTITQIAKQSDIPFEFKLDYIEKNPCLHYLSDGRETNYLTLLEINDSKQSNI